ncbi:MAG TPA: type IV pilin protein [Burkholderiaceae bacterium]|nr:type IV pilin protein [Burkholderiaceae bacterium]
MRRFDFGGGFTLIELLIVVMVVAVLLSIALPAYNDYTTRSRLNAAAGTLKEVRSRMEQRYADNRTYANGAGTGCAIGDFSEPASGFAFACVLTNGGQGFTWTATGSGSTAGFTYRTDETGIETTLAAKAGWTAATLPVNRLILRKE